MDFIVITANPSSAHFPHTFPHSSSDYTIACLLVRDNVAVLKRCFVSVAFTLCMFARRYLHLPSRVASMCVCCCLDLGFPYS